MDENKESEKLKLRFVDWEGTPYTYALTEFNRESFEKFLDWLEYNDLLRRWRIDY
jgi:hypothetical protein